VKYEFTYLWYTSIGSNNIIPPCVVDQLQKIAVCSNSAMLHCFSAPT